MCAAYGKIIIQDVTLRIYIHNESLLLAGG